MWRSEVLDLVQNYSQFQWAVHSVPACCKKLLWVTLILQPTYLTMTTIQVLTTGPYNRLFIPAILQSWVNSDEGDLLLANYQGSTGANLNEIFHLFSQATRSVVLGGKYFCKEAPLLIFDRTLSTPLVYSEQFSITVWQFHQFQLLNKLSWRVFIHYCFYMN